MPQILNSDKTTSRELLTEASLGERISFFGATASQTKLSLAKATYVSTILPLRATRPDKVFLGEMEQIHLVPMARIAFTILQHTSNPDANEFTRAVNATYVSDTLTKEARMWSALARVISLSSIKEVSKILSNEAIDQAAGIIGSYSDIRSKALEDERRTTPSQALESLLESNFSADPQKVKDQLEKDRLAATDMIDKSILGDYFQSLMKYAGETDGLTDDPDHRTAVLNVYNIIETALERMVYTERIVTQKTEIHDHYIENFFALASYYSWYRKAVQSPGDYQVYSTANMSQDQMITKFNTWKAAADRHSKIIMNFAMAPMRIGNGMISSLISDSLSLAQKLKFVDQRPLKDLITDFEAIDGIVPITGHNFFDTFGRDYMREIKKQGKDADSLIVPFTILELFSVPSLTYDPATSYDLETGTLSVQDDIPQTSRQSLSFEDEAKFIHVLRNVMKALRSTKTHIAEGLLQVTTPAGASQMSTWSIDGSLLKAEVPQNLADFDTFDVARRVITKMPTGQIFLPRYQRVDGEGTDPKLLVEDMIYKPIRWNSFVASKAHEEYDVNRMYWPPVPGFSLLDTSVMRWSRAFLPKCYIEDVVPTKHENLTIKTLKAQLKTIAMKEGVHSDYLSHAASMMETGYETKFVVQGLSATFLVYKVDLDQLASGEITPGMSFTSSTPGVSLMASSTNLSYGLPLPVLEKAQPDTLTKDKYEVITVKNKFKDKPSTYVFRMIEFFPEPTRSAELAFYHGANSLVSASISAHFLSWLFAEGSGYESSKVRKVAHGGAVYVPSDMASLSDILTKPFKSDDAYITVSETAAKTLKEAAPANKFKRTITTSGVKLHTPKDGDREALEIKFWSSSPSMISAVWPHSLYKVSAPSDAGISFDSVIERYLAKRSIYSMANAMFTIVTDTTSDHVMVLPEDIHREENIDLQSGASYEHIENVTSVSVSTMVEKHDTVREKGTVPSVPGPVGNDTPASKAQDDGFVASDGSALTAELNKEVSKVKDAMMGAPAVETTNAKNEGGDGDATTIPGTNSKADTDSDPADGDGDNKTSDEELSSEDN